MCKVRGSVVAGGLVAALLGALTPAHAAPMIKTLAGTTVISAARSGMVRVRLPRTTHVALTDIKRLEGRGRFFGFVLREERGDALVEDMGVGYCLTVGCRPVFPYGGAGCVCTTLPDGQRTIFEGDVPAGTYRLYVVADGGPTKVRLTLRGLGGSTTVTPTQTSRVGILAPPPANVLPTSATPAEPGLLYSAGATYRAGSAGAHHTLVLWKYHPVPQEPTFVNVCVYDGAAPADRPYQYPCANAEGAVPLPTGNAGTGKPGPTPLGQYMSTFLWSANFPAGTWSVGAYSNTAGPAEDPHLQELWIDY